MKIALLVFTVLVAGCGQGISPTPATDAAITPNVGPVFVRPHFVVVPAVGGHAYYVVKVSQRGFKGYEFAFTSCLEVNVSPGGYAAYGHEKFLITPAHGTATTCKIKFIGTKGRVGVLTVKING